jgi:hypothetical protein
MVTRGVSDLGSSTYLLFGTGEFFNFLSQQQNSVLFSYKMRVTTCFFCGGAVRNNCEESLGAMSSIE